MPSDESKGSQLDAIGSLAQRQLDNTLWTTLKESAGYVFGPKTAGSMESMTYLYLCTKAALRREIPWILRGFQGRLSC